MDSSLERLEKTCQAVIAQLCDIPDENLNTPFTKFDQKGWRGRIGKSQSSLIKSLNL